jgi:uncharacterized protein (TIGR03437 family)
VRLHRTLVAIRRLRCVFPLLLIPLLLIKSPAFAQEYLIYTWAGGGLTTPPSATSAAIGGLTGVATDTLGNVYFTALNCVFSRSATGNLSVVAGNSRPGYSGDGGAATVAQLNNPWGVALDSAGNLYIGDSGNNRVRRISPSGIITTVAGNGNAIYGGDGLAAVSAGLSAYGVTVDSTGNLYIADAANQAIRKVSPAGVITTVAGNGVPGFSGDAGPAASAELDNPLGVAVDSLGNVYIADTNNSRIREVSSGIITTFAGNGNFAWSGDGGPATSAALDAPYGLAVDGAGNVYVADTENAVVRRISAGGTITTVAGNGSLGFSGDGGTATSAELGLCFGIALDQKGNFYVADAENLRVREVSSAGVIGTVAGDGVFSYGGDGGLAVGAQLGAPHAIALDTAGNVYFADTANNRIRRIAASPAGVITTVAGTGAQGYSGDGGQAASAALNRPEGIAFDSAGNMYIADTNNNAIRKVATSGVISTIAGGNGYSNTGDGGAATSAALAGPTAVLPDGKGNLYIADSGSARIRIVSAAGIISTVAGSVLRSYGGDGGPATSAFLNNPSGMALDSQGNLYFADAGNNAIRKVAALGGGILTIAGNGTPGFSGDGGPATSAEFNSPSGVAIDAAGDIYVTDSGNHRVREISRGIATTVAGSGAASYMGDGGAATTATLVSPYGIALAGNGNIYVSDTVGSIRLLQPSTQALLISAVLDGASESANPLATGKIAVIYGFGLGPAQLTENQPQGGVYGTQAAGTTVSIGGTPAPILYTSDTQVGVQVPYGLAGSVTSVTVSYQGRISVPYAASLAPASPNLFSVNGTGAGQAAAVNGSGGVNSATNPASVGSFVSLFATGVGQTSPAAVAGSIASAAPYPQPTLPVSVIVGGLPAPVSYAGAAPGEVNGVTQINVQIPAGVQPGGYVPVVLKAGNAASSGGVWIAVSAH